MLILKIMYNFYSFYKQIQTLRDETDWIMTYIHGTHYKNEFKPFKYFKCSNAYNIENTLIW